MTSDESVQDANAWRTRMAREIAAHYAVHPDVEAVALIGSVSRGWADAYSDIEFGVFWRGEPLEEDRRAIVAQMAGTNRDSHAFDAPTIAWGEAYYLRGVKVDMGHWQTAAMDQIVSDVVDRFDIALPKQTSVSALLHALPLHGDAIVRRWRERAGRYPDELAAAMARQHLSFSPMWMLRMLAERGDFPLVRHNLSALANKLFLVLCGLNRVYYPGHKWIPRHLAGMRIAPPHFPERLEAALTSPLSDSVAAFAQMIDEIVDLTDAHLSTVDTSAVRARLAEPPHRWLQPPEDQAVS